MGIWAGIKHSLNSTLGTSEFQPLDKLLMYGSKRFSIGNDVYATVYTGSATSTIPANTITGSTVNLCSIRPKLGGSFTMRASGSVSKVSGTTIYCKILVYINDVHYNTATFSANSSSTTTSGNITMTIPSNAGDKISFKLQGGLSMSVETNYSASCSGISILANVVDNLIDIL